MAIALMSLKFLQLDPNPTDPTDFPPYPAEVYGAKSMYVCEPGDRTESGNGL